MHPVLFFIRLFAIIIATLFSLRILFVLVQRVPGVVVALSIIAIAVFGVAFYRGGLQSIGIRSRKASALAIIAATILLIISTAILINIG